MKPPKTMPARRTLGGLLDWIQTQEWSRSGEGFSAATQERDYTLDPCNPHDKGRPWRLIAYWTPGSNEGYYVHVSALHSPSRLKQGEPWTRTETPLITGKFWSPEAAEDAARALTAVLWYLEDVTNTAPFSPAKEGA